MTTTPPKAATGNAPQDDFITSYDKAHLLTYLRLLDAERDQAGLLEIGHIILGLDPSDRERTERIVRSHLSRAHWMIEQGYRHLLDGARRT